MLAPTTAKPTEVEAIVTVTVMVDALEHKTVTGEVVVVAVTVDIMRNTMQSKNILSLYIFPIGEDRNTSRRVIVNTPGAGTQVHLVHSRYMDRTFCYSYISNTVYAQTSTPNLM